MIEEDPTRRGTFRLLSEEFNRIDTDSCEPVLKRQEEVFKKQEIRCLEKRFSISKIDAKKKPSPIN